VQEKITYRLFVLFVPLLIATGVCPARQPEKVPQPSDREPAPIIVRCLEYGFGILDVTRGEKGKIDAEFSVTFNDRHMFHGIDILDDHRVVIPAATLIFGDSGFSGKVLDAYPLSSGFETSVERNYVAFYTNAFMKNQPLATHYTVNYWYYGKQKIPGRKNDSQEIGTTFSWPTLLAVGDGRLTPNYYIGYIWSTRSNSKVREREGLIHIFGLGYDFEISGFWPNGESQAFKLCGDVTYNDGYGGVAIEHDWSHATFRMSTNLVMENWTFTPSLNYQISMDDSVNNENELWFGITTTYRF
jgi:hypothetical protein